MKKARKYHNNLQLKVHLLDFTDLFGTQTPSCIPSLHVASRKSIMASVVSIGRPLWLEVSVRCNPSTNNSSRLDEVLKQLRATMHNESNDRTKDSCRNRAIGLFFEIFVMISLLSSLLKDPFSTKSAPTQRWLSSMEKVSSQSRKERLLKANWIFYKSTFHTATATFKQRHLPVICRHFSMATTKSSPRSEG